MCRLAQLQRSIEALRSEMSKTATGNFFEDFHIGQEIRHATPRTVTAGDVALYTALTGSRFVVQSSDAFASALGYPHAPIDDLLTFHVVFGKTVPDISLNAIANLGYADCRFLEPVYRGDTLSTTSLVIGLRETSNRDSGIVYVRSTGINQRGETVLEYSRWVLVNKRDPASPAPETVVPELDPFVGEKELAVPDGLDCSHYDYQLAGSDLAWDDYQVGEKIDHVDGMTIEEAEHTMASKLYQNPARVHLNQHVERDGRFGKRRDH